MSDSEFVTAVHKNTGIVSQVPRAYVESVYPHLYKELSDDEVVELRRKAEFELYGEYITPEPKPAKKEGAK
jgi:nucleoid DNA-binding protein